MTKSRILFSPPYLDDSDIDVVIQTLRNGWIAPVGPELDQFEKELKGRFKLNQVLALNSGTAALHLAVKLAGVSQGDKVVVGSFTFIAAANAVLYEGGIPVFMDSDGASWNLDPNLLEEYLYNQSRRNDLPKAVIVTHIFGRPAKIQQIHTICKAYGVKVIEDAAEALGTYIDGVHVGCFGDLGVLSFNGNKLLTTGGGGALLCNDSSFLHKAKYWANQSKGDADYYDHEEVGYNYRLSNVLAGLGLGQLGKFDYLLATKKANYSKYLDALDQVKFLELIESPIGSNDWIFPVLIRREYVDDSIMSRILAAFKSDNIEARMFWKPLHLQPLFKEAAFVGSGICEDLFNRGVCLPSGVGLTDEERGRVVDVLKYLEC